MAEVEQDMADPTSYPELTDALPDTVADALIDCICAATGIHPDDLDGDDWPLARLVERLQADYANGLTEADRYFLLGQLAALHLQIPTHTVTLASGAQLFVCKSCLCELRAEMGQPWQGHAPNCAHQHRAALMTKLDADVARYLLV